MSSRQNKYNWDNSPRSLEYGHDFGIFVDPETPHITPRTLDAGIHFRQLGLMEPADKLKYLKNYYSEGQLRMTLKNWNSQSVEGQIGYMRKRFGSQYQKSKLEQRLIWVRKNVPKFWYNNKAFSIFAIIIWIITDWYR